MKTKLAGSLIKLFAAFILIPFSSFGQLTLVEWNFPLDPDNAVADGGITANLSKTITTVGGTGTIIFSNNGVTTKSAWADGWDNGSGLKYWQIEFTTSGYYDLDITSRQQSSGTGPRDFKIQYKVGAAGSWIDLFSPITISTTGGWYGPASPVNLPSACDNQNSVYIRWIMTSNTAQNASAVAVGGASRIDDIIVRGKATNDYYRTIANGNWDNIAIWEKSADNITWYPAELKPSFYAKTITIRNPHTVTISSSNSIDETIIESGATLDYFSGTITLNEGPGVDLQINGTFIDQSSTVAWVSNATWTLGANATYIKSGNGSAAVWRDNYQGGITNIPASANWIIRKNSGVSPSVVSVSMYYPNLTIENFTGGTWVSGPTSSFTGSTSSPVVKGNLDIGGSGTSTVDFMNDNINASPVLVLGNVTIKSGSTLRNNGTGFEIRGNLIVNGTLAYGSANARLILLSGVNNQAISGTGTLNMNNMTVNKSANSVTLLRSFTVDSLLTLSSGRVFTSSSNLLTINTNAIVNGTNNSSFIHGPVAKRGIPAFTFPVGKNNDYQPMAMGVGTDVNDVFVAEYFYTDPQVVYGNSLDVTLDHISKCEYWFLNRSAGTSSRTVTLSWDANSCGVSFLPDLRVARYNGTLWQDHGNGGTTGNTTLGTIVSSSPLSVYGPFTLASSSTLNPLPVELVYFNASAKENIVKTEWVTASELNNHYFEVQRSSNGVEFEPVGIVLGAGNSNSFLRYELYDYSPLSGISYYRLRQIDFDGTESISSIIPVKLTRQKISVYPNPANTFINVHSDKESSVIFIKSASGKIIHQSKIGLFDRVDVSNFAPGLYFCEISDGNSPLFVEKLLISR